MMDPILTVSGLAVEIAGAEALADVSFAVPRGSCLSIVGETGSGKTITCRTLLGLAGRSGARIARGTLEFEGEDLTALDEARWRAIRGKRIALVPQASLSSMDPLMRVGKQLQEAIVIHDPAARPHERALELLEQVQMPRASEVLRRYPHELSGGMRQRAMIALALSGRPSLLIADEPTTALDVTVQRRILALLSSIRTDAGMSMIFVSHDLGVVRSISEYVTIMYAGMTVETGPVADVFEHPLHPYTRALIAAQPGHTRRDASLVAIPGTPPPLGDRPSGCPFAPRCPLALERCTQELPGPAGEGEHTASCWRSGALAA